MKFQEYLWIDCVEIREYQLNTRKDKKLNLEQMHRIVHQSQLIWPPLSFLSSSSRQHHLQVKAGPTPRSTPTSRSWRSHSPACPPSPLAHLSISWVTGKPTKTWAAGISTTTEPPESGPGSPRAPGTPAAAPAVSAETARVQWRVRWGTFEPISLCGLSSYEQFIIIVIPVTSVYGF